MTKGQETAQRLIAIVVIMAMLGVMGIPLTVIVFFATVVYFVWRAVQRSEQQDVKNIFDFYIAANEVLRDEEKRWYGFEISSVVAEGERVLHLMPDPPPLVYFTLGAPELRRYVEVLRRIEREPTEAPQTMAAIRSLERSRRTRAAAMLEESRARLRAASHGAIASASTAQKPEDKGLHTLPGKRQRHAPAPPMPPPIAEVLRDVYEEEKKTE